VILVFEATILSVGEVNGCQCVSLNTFLPSTDEEVVITLVALGGAPLPLSVSFQILVEVGSESNGLYMVSYPFLNFQDFVFVVKAICKSCMNCLDS
jgi:hypothetical protein